MRLLFSIIFSFMLGMLFALVSTDTRAAICMTQTTDGQTAFLYKPDPKTGKITPTAYIFAATKTIDQCKITSVTVRKEIVETYVVPNPQTACEKSAVLACEPSFGGLPICTTNNFANFCGFCLLTTKASDGMGDVTLRYINGQVYSGDKSTPDGAISCPNTQLTQ